MRITTNADNIRKDLNKIRYYFAKRNMFNDAFEDIGQNKIMQVVSKYNTAICDADPQLYEIYLNLYVKNQTQERTANTLGYSLSYIQKQNTNLIKFFQNQFEQSN